jgi:hypothetical protein
MSDGDSKLQVPGSGLWDEARQLLYPAAYRISLPQAALDWEELPAPAPAAAPVAPSPAASAADAEPGAIDRHLAAVATCLWYLKTKFFKRAWDLGDMQDDDPRVRRALSRLNKGIDTLSEAGVSLEDPTNRRYPPGSESLMRPIQTQPTPGLTFERVSETVTPIVYRNDRLIQRGEVFVAVPQQSSEPSHTGGANQF